MQGDMGLGQIQIFISKADSTHTPEFWADRAMARIMFVGDTAPQPIRDQAHQVEEYIKKVVFQTIVSAIEERRARDALLAERKGDNELAQIIREDR